jgi:hypothetical protein
VKPIFVTLIHSADKKPVMINVYQIRALVSLGNNVMIQFTDTHSISAVGTLEEIQQAITRACE